MFSRKSCLAHCRPNGRSCEAGRACEGAWLAKTAPTRAAYYQQPASPLGLPWVSVAWADSGTIGSWMVTDSTPRASALHSPTT